MFPLVCKICKLNFLYIFIYIYREEVALIFNNHCPNCNNVFDINI